MADTAWEALRQQVYQRANGCCEYCQTSELNIGQTMQVDHINPDNGEYIDNLCLACWNCNNHKRAVISVTDAQTGEIFALFNPRTQRWSDHFEWTIQATQIRGITSTGRVTVERLKMNRPSIVIARKRWGEGGYHPP